MKGKFSKKIFKILLRRMKLKLCIGHCPLQKLCILFRSDKNSGCYGKTYSFHILIMGKLEISTVSLGIIEFYLYRNVY